MTTHTETEHALRRIAKALEQIAAILNDICADEAITMRKVY